MPKSTDLIDLASRYWESAALNAAVSLGIFPLLAMGSATADTVTTRLQSSPQHTEALLDSLCGLGVLEKSNKNYSIPRHLEALLDPASPDCLLGALAFNGDLFQLWAKLPECIQTGTPAMPANPHLGSDPNRMRRFVEGMHSRAGIMARGVLPALYPRPHSKILDVGGGPGTFSIKLLERDPTLTATVLDLPPVVQAAAEIHAGNPALERLTFQGGDYHTADFPADQDIVLYCGALHQEPESGIHDLFQRMKAALKPTGTLHVVDLMVSAERTEPVYSALFQLNMMLMRPASRVYSTDDLLAILRETGFTPKNPQTLSGTPYTLVTATN